MRLRKLFPSRNARIRELLVTLEKVIPTDASLLVLGESGTGKNYVAELIHRASPRHAGAFLRIDCASLPEELFEAELFGYEPGAFTDAKERKSGRLELAHRGTLYLDEVSALAPASQAKLLRFVQERTLSRLGGSHSLSIDTRIISSSNLPLAELVAGGGFRSDLFYRLNVVALTLPPLRERREDIPLLARSFLRQAGRRIGRHFGGFDDEALRILRRYLWPGNVRELENVVQRAAILEAGTRITAESLPLAELVGDEILIEEGLEGSWSLERMEKRYIREVLRRTGGNFSWAARILGINRKTLLEKRRKYGLD
ncbi:MAG TPA: sigma-54 dependent transcriptional regulator [Thermoanaerobaculia bacterium]|nr:sigma-54 dependent transcriptional regulator [Thermoanaerobaculia bacterium]